MYQISPWRYIHNMKAFNTEHDMQCLYSASLINTVTTAWQRLQCRGGLCRELQVISSKKTVKLFLGSSISKLEAFFAASLEINSKENKQVEKLGCLV